MTPQQLAAVGQALYGPCWRRAMAKALGTSEKEVQLVESGRAPAPEAWRAQLVALAQDMALRALEAANNLLWREADAAEAAPASGFAAAGRHV
jgi:hypothetical protein